MGVHSHHGSWTHPGVVTNHVGGMGHALADLVALGGDDLLAVLDGGHVHMLGTHSPANSPGDENVDNDNDDDDDDDMSDEGLPGSVCRDLLALFDRDGVTDGL